MYLETPVAQAFGVSHANGDSAEVAVRAWKFGITKQANCCGQDNLSHGVKGVVKQQTLGGCGCGPKQRHVFAV